MASASSWRTLSATSPVSSMLRPTSGLGLLGLRMTRPPWPVAPGDVEGGAAHLVDAVGGHDHAEPALHREVVVLVELRDLLEGEVVGVVGARGAGDGDPQAQRARVLLAVADLEDPLEGVGADREDVGLRGLVGLGISVVSVSVVISHPSGNGGNGVVDGFTRPRPC